MDPFFIADSEHGVGRVLVLNESVWRDEHRNVLASGAVDGLRISVAWRSGLAFLEEVDRPLRSIEVYFNERVPMRTRPLGRFAESLEVLALHCRPEETVPLGDFPRLRRFSAAWHRRLESCLGHPGLEVLSLERSPVQDLQTLEGMRSMTRLQLTNGGLRSLRGIGQLTGLEELDLFQIRGLGSLGGIEECQTLRALKIARCRRIEDVQHVAALRGLRSIALDSVGTIESLDPLLACRQLRWVQLLGSTSVRDGNLAGLEDLPDLRRVSFTPRRHYNASPLELNEVLRARARPA